MEKKSLPLSLLIIGALFLGAGVRDMVAPGFLSISPKIPDSATTSTRIILGLLSFGAALVVMRRRFKQPLEK
jgi:hypothetical protein